MVDLVRYVGKGKWNFVPCECSESLVCHWCIWTSLPNPIELKEEAQREANRRRKLIQRYGKRDIRLRNLAEVEG